MLADRPPLPAGLPSTGRAPPSGREEEVRMARNYDAVVIGGGHNGLVAAC
jgi:hypothetical protein